MSESVVGYPIAEDRPSTMPPLLALVRHGESEGQVASRLEKQGDLSAFTEEFRNTSSAEWNLSRKGFWQARMAAAWMREHLMGSIALPEKSFDRGYFSSLKRARQTMGALLLQDLVAPAMINGQPVPDHYNVSYDIRLRELDFGNVSTIPQQEFRELYPDSVLTRRIDPLYGRTPGGESIADVMDRSRGFFGSLARAHERGVRSALVVSHGRHIRSNQLSIEGIDPLKWHDYEGRSENEIKNCQVVLYSRRNPETGAESPTYRWTSSTCPWETPDQPPQWREFSVTMAMTAEDCLKGIPGEWLNDPL